MRSTRTASRQWMQASVVALMRPGIVERHAARCGSWIPHAPDRSLSVTDRRRELRPIARRRCYTTQAIAAARESERNPAGRPGPRSGIPGGLMGMQELLGAGAVARGRRHRTTGNRRRCRGRDTGDHDLIPRLRARFRKFTFPSRAHAGAPVRLGVGRERFTTRLRRAFRSPPEGRSRAQHKPTPAVGRPEGHDVHARGSKDCCPVWPSGPVRVTAGRIRGNSG